MGAALEVGAAAPAPVAHMYLGTSYSDEEILTVLGRHAELSVSRPENVAQAVAEDDIRLDKKRKQEKVRHLLYEARSSNNRHFFGAEEYIHGMHT